MEEMTGMREGWWNEEAKLDNYWFEDNSEAEEIQVSTDLPELEIQPWSISPNSPHFTKLPNRLLLQLLAYLTVKEVLRLTTLCSYLSHVRFNYNYLKSLELKPSGPLHSPHFMFRRREFIDCLRRKALSKAIPNPALQHTIVASNRAQNILKVEVVGAHVLYFSESNGRLIVWEIRKEAQVTIYNLECPKHVHGISLEKGKIALMGKFQLEVKYFPWESLLSVDITSHHYSWTIENNEGTVYFYSPSRLVVAIASYHVMVFSDTLQLLRRLRDTSWPFNFIQSCKIHSDLPYLAVAGERKIMIYDVSLLDRNRPVYEHEMPILCDYKLYSIVVNDLSKSKCFLIVHNSHRSKDAVLLVNGKLLYKASGDSAVLDNYLFVFSQLEMRIIQFEFTISGPKQVHSFRVYERFLDSILVCTYEKCMIIARKEHTQNSFYASLYDYNGWQFCKFALTDFYPETAISTIDMIALYGHYSKKTTTKILIQFNYFRTDNTPLALDKYVAFEQQKDALVKKDLSGVAAAREEFFKTRREEFREELAKKQKFNEFKQSKYWKPSRRGVPAITLDEDFSLC